MSLPNNHCSQDTGRLQQPYPQCKVSQLIVYLWNYKHFYRRLFSPSREHKFSFTHFIDINKLRTSGLFVVRCFFFVGTTKQKMGWLRWNTDTQSVTIQQHSNSAQTHIYVHIDAPYTHSHAHFRQFFALTLRNNNEKNCWDLQIFFFIAQRFVIFELWVWRGEKNKIKKNTRNVYNFFIFFYSLRYKIPAIFTCLCLWSAPRWRRSDCAGQSSDSSRKYAFPLYECLAGSLRFPFKFSCDSPFNPPKLVSLWPLADRMIPKTPSQV